MSVCLENVFRTVRVRVTKGEEVRTQTPNEHLGHFSHLLLSPPIVLLPDRCLPLEPPQCAAEVTVGAGQSHQGQDVGQTLELQQAPASVVTELSKCVLMGIKLKSVYNLMFGLLKMRIPCCHVAKL